MKRSTSDENTVGEIVNHMSLDCQRIQDSLTFSYYLVVSFVTIGMALVQLFPLVGMLGILLYDVLNALSMCI